MSAAAIAMAPAGQARAVLRVALAIAVAVALVAGAGWWLRTSEWPIHDVRVDGAVAYTDRDRLRDVVARHARAGFFGMDLEALRADLRALPWVRDASLRRVWPDTLDLTISEHEVAARWNGDALLSPRGAVFEPPAAYDARAPRLAGPEGHGAAMLERLHAFADELAPLGLEVVALEQNARRGWRAELNNGVVLRLGRTEQLAARVARFAAVWPRALAGEAERIASVDLRYPNGFAVAWRQERAGRDASATGGA